MGTTERDPVTLAVGTLPVTAIGVRFKSLRIVDPPAERTILNSMRQYGQLTPVVVCRLSAGEHELLDGFKRLRAASKLGLEELTVRYLDVGLRAGKAAMLQLNRVGRSISIMEESLVVHSLCHDDGLSQVEVSELLGRHKSWVSRRVALIARLCGEAQERIKLGLLPASLGAELARLQRCNQQRMLEAISRHHLTWRETRKVVSALQHQPASAYERILRDPRQAVLGGGGEAVALAPAEEKGLGIEAKALRQKLLAFERLCLETALLLSGTDLAQFESEEESILRKACKQALGSLARVERELHQITGGDGHGGFHPEPAGS